MLQVGWLVVVQLVQTEPGQLRLYELAKRSVMERAALPMECAAWPARLAAPLVEQLA